MLVIDNAEHLHGVLKQIEEEEEGLLPLLEEQFRYLHSYGRGNCNVHIGWDFAKWSFSLLFVFPDRCGCMNGGLIFHFPRAPDPLSVGICPSSRPHWSVHT